MVEGCNAPHNAKGYCKVHYMRLKRTGSLELQPNKRSTKNEWYIKDDYVELVITNRKGEKQTFLVDKDIYEEIKDYRWCYVNYKNTHFYCKNVTLGYLHRYVLGLPKNRTNDIVSDHINRNTLDCRRSNLRVCTIAENNLNQSIRKNCRSGVKGVHWNKRERAWKVEIKYKGQYKYLGRYKDFEEAKKARIDYELKHFKEFSPYAGGQSA